MTVSRAVLHIDSEDGNLSIEGRVEGPYDPTSPAHVALSWLSNNWNVVQSAVGVALGVGEQSLELVGLTGPSKFDDKLFIEIRGQHYPTADVVRAAFEECGQNKAQWNAMTDDERDYEIDQYIARLDKIQAANETAVAVRKGTGLVSASGAALSPVNHYDKG